MSFKMSEFHGMDRATRHASHGRHREHGEI